VIVSNIVNSGRDGIYLRDDSGSSSIRDNNVTAGTTAWGAWGITLDFSPDSTLQDNYVLVLDGDGIVLRWSPRLIVEGNSVRAQDDGIGDFDSPGSNISRNTVFADGGFGIGIFSPSQRVIENQATSVTEEAIVVFESGNLLERNIAEDGFVGIALYASGNELNDNRACNNTNLDFLVSPVTLLNVGRNNTCDKPDGWNDEGVTGCTYSCEVVPVLPELTPPGWGIDHTTYWTDKATIDEHIDLLADLGVKWVRTNVYMDYLMPTEQNWDPETGEITADAKWLDAYHYMFEKMREKGMSPFVVVGVFPGPPKPSHVPSFLDVGSTEFFEAFEDYVRFSVREFGQYTNYWQVGNEYNHFGGRPTGLNDDDFFELYKRGVNVIKSENEDALTTVNVYVSEILPTSPWKWDFWLVLTRSALRENWDKIDFIGLNYFPCTWDWGAPEGWRGIIDKATQFGKPLVVTEVGYSTGGLSACIIQDPGMQVPYVHRALDTITTTKKTTGAFWFNLIDYLTTPEVEKMDPISKALIYASAEGHFGLFYDNIKKPAYRHLMGEISFNLTTLVKGEEKTHIDNYFGEIFPITAHITNTRDGEIALGPTDSQQTSVDLTYPFLAFNYIGGNATHIEIDTLPPKETRTYSWDLQTLMASEILGTNEFTVSVSGLFNEGDRAENQNIISVTVWPVTLSQIEEIISWLKNVLSTWYFTPTVTQDQTVTVGTFDVPVGTGDLIVWLDYPSTNLDLVIISPSDITITPDMPNVGYSGDVKPEYYSIHSPEPGNWTVQVYGKEVPSSVEAEVYVLWTVPVLDVTPTEWIAEAEAGTNVSLTFTTSEIGRFSDIYNVTFTASDLVDRYGYVISSDNFNFSINHFNLPHGQSQNVTVNLTIPAEAYRGDYNGEIKVTTLNDGDATIPVNLTVTKAPKLIKIDSISKLEDAKTGIKEIDKEISRIVKHVQKSLADKKNGSLWIDDWHIVVKHGKKVFHEERAAVKHMQKEIKKKETSEGLKVVYESVMSDLVEADKLLAEIAIEDAKNVTVKDPHKQKKVDHEIAKAEEEFSKALEEISKDRPDKAIKKFEKAWEHAQHAIKHAEKEAKG
jgi:parallel beta-helix repeat protein